MKARPVVIGALGVVSKKFYDFVKLVDLGNLNLYILQKSALLGTILVLQLSGAGCSQVD